jgi:UDP-N-acetylmuramoyl-tripeptide--D-alanyl-D-alanine ligase
LFIPLKGSNCDGHFFIVDALNQGAAASFMQQGNPLSRDLIDRCQKKTLIEVADPLQALGDLAHYWRKKFSVTIVAISGSNGKTTTKEMAWHVARSRFTVLKNPGNWNNLIGLPLSLLQLNEYYQIGILEMGMSGLGEIERLAQIAVPRIGVITNIGPAHLEQLKTIDTIMEAKGELFAALGVHDIAVVNRDDARVVSLTQRTRARIISYGTQEGDVRGTVAYTDNGTDAVFNLDIAGEKLSITVPLPAGMFLGNALAAAAIAYALDMGAEEIGHGLAAFQALPGRMELIDAHGVRIINDAYNANPVSMEASLTVLSSIKKKNRTIAVLGDMLELGETAAVYHRTAGRRAAQLGIEYLFVCGTYAASLAAGAQEEGMIAQHIFQAQSPDLLAPTLAEVVQEGDWVLVKGSRAMHMEKIIEYLQKRTNT